MPDLFDPSLLSLVCIYALMAWSFWLPLASGQLSLATPGAVAVGAYVAGRLSQDADVALPVLVLAGALGGGILLCILSPLTIRLSGYSFALATLGISQGIPVLIGSREELGGAFGIAGVPSSDLVLPLSAGLCLLLILVSRAMFAGEPGRVVDSIKTDELQARALGISVNTTKVLILVAQGVVAGAAGALYASYVGYIEPSMFNIGLMIEIFAYVVIGGMTNVLGPFFGAALLTVSLEVLAVTGDSRHLLFGALLLVVILVRRDGSLRRSRALQRRRVEHLLPADHLPGATQRAPIHT